ncbi:hypothetical protein C9374_002583 [Naegleria lovaniensis]|uniref:Uncharacterized protein n=1 Tax=Naegleria lovaniensis TaxID=51637 RepID=A0AA88GNX2_NAELO|nr:uncharacterized protein C9374_002583 [Naegleria lovaniensis]KAG2386137.1 hypothetical protein C9374_002583 [Naegleria lovaniensis]
MSSSIAGTSSSSPLSSFLDGFLSTTKSSSGKSSSNSSTQQQHYLQQNNQYDGISLTALQQQPQSDSLQLAEEIANILSICVIMFSFLCSLFVLINLCKKNMKAEKEEKAMLARFENSNPSIIESLTSKKHLYTKLTSFCILCMIISDLLFTAFYFPTNTLRLIKGFLFQDLPKAQTLKLDPYFSIPIYITAEITEMFVISSGIFSLLLTLCIYKTIKSIKPSGSSADDQSSNYSSSNQRSSIGLDSQYHQSVSHYGTNGASTTPYGNGGDQSNMDPYQDHQHTEKTRLMSPNSDMNSVNTPPRTPEEEYGNHDAHVQQPFSAKGRYMKMQQRKKWIQTIFCLISWGIPAMFAVVWIIVEELYLGVNTTPAGVFYANIIPDMVKNLIYIAIEVGSVALRIMIYTDTKKLFRDTTIVENTSSAKKKREKERNLFKQLLFYALPFFLFGIWVIVYRLATDIIYIVRVAEHGIDSFNDDMDLAGLIVLSIHHILSPLRAFANSVVYCLLSKWFSERVKGSFKRCCGHSQ